MKRACEVCGAPFRVEPAVAQRGFGRYCSRPCVGRAKQLRRAKPDFDALFAAWRDGVQPEPNSGCWLWTGAYHGDGYGIISQFGRRYYVHRLALMASGVNLSSRDCACHTCDVPACANPAHLWVGSRGDNSRDMGRKGRARGKAKLTPEAVRAIRADGRNQYVIAAEYGVAQTLISQIRRNLIWRHVL